MAYKVRGIMILDLRKLKRSGKDQSDFFFEYSPEKDLIDIPSAEIKGAVKVSGSVQITGDHSCYIEGEVVFTVKGECTRCLNDAENVYVAEFKEAVEENNPDGYSVKNDTVDLSIIVDDVIAMNVPVSFLCDENCKGICVG
ncbi:MAG: DUF177 domain-containing protein, partial [Clostridia bacterium]|nr:DUF177 domain-containing protein [Clostridia bacterium]